MNVPYEHAYTIIHNFLGNNPMPHVTAAATL